MERDERLSIGAKMLLALDEGPWDIVFRATVGLSIMPTHNVLFGAPYTAGSLIGCLSLVLAATRIVPGVVRRAVPFSNALQSTWSERRATAKRSDAFQWRKLFGIGLGWIAYLVMHRLAFGAPYVLALACVGAGAAGMVAWRRQQMSTPSA